MKSADLDSARGITGAMYFQENRWRKKINGSGRCAVGITLAHRREVRARNVIEERACRRGEITRTRETGLPWRGPSTLEALECNEPVCSLEKGQKEKRTKRRRRQKTKKKKKQQKKSRRNRGPQESRTQSKIKRMERNERREAKNWVKRREHSVERERKKRAYECVRATWTSIIVVVMSSFLSSPFYLPRLTLSVFRQEIEMHSSCTSAPEASTNEIVHRYTRCLQSRRTEWRATIKLSPTVLASYNINCKIKSLDLLSRFQSLSISAYLYFYF